VSPRVQSGVLGTTRRDHLPVEEALCTGKGTQRLSGVIAVQRGAVSLASTDSSRA